MALPKITQLTFSTILPESGLELRYRPFNVKEAKILMLHATDNKKSFKESYMAIIDMLQACTFNKIEVIELSNIDFEKLFIAVKCKSIGSIEKKKYKCTNKFNDTKCCREVAFDIDFDAIKLDGEIPSSTITLSEDLIIKLRIPTIKFVTDAAEAKLNELEIIAACLETVTYQNETSTEFDLDEAMEFIESLNETQITPLANYFNSIPKLTYEISMTCSQCSYIHEFKFKGIEDFFG